VLRLYRGYARWNLAASPLGWWLYLFESGCVVLPQQLRASPSQKRTTGGVRRPSTCSSFSLSWVTWTNKYVHAWTSPCVRVHAPAFRPPENVMKNINTPRSCHPVLVHELILNAFPTEVIPLSRLLWRKPLIYEMNSMTQETTTTTTTTMTMGMLILRLLRATYQATATDLPGEMTHVITAIRRAYLQRNDLLVSLARDI